MSATPCRGCKRAVLWKKTPAGAWMALDPDRIYTRLIPAAEATEEEKSAGTRRTLVLDDGKTVLGYEVPPTVSGRGDPVTGRVPHWATCSHAAQFRRAGTA